MLPVEPGHGATSGPGQRTHPLRRAHPRGHRSGSGARFRSSLISDRSAPAAGRAVRSAAYAPDQCCSRSSRCWSSPRVSVATDCVPGSVPYHHHSANTSWIAAAMLGVGSDTTLGARHPIATREAAREAASPPGAVRCAGSRGASASSALTPALKAGCRATRCASARLSFSPLPVLSRCSRQAGGSRRPCRHATHADSSPRAGCGR